MQQTTTQVNLTDEEIEWILDQLKLAHRWSRTQETLELEKKLISCKSD